MYSNVYEFYEPVTFEATLSSLSKYKWVRELVESINNVHENLELGSGTYLVMGIYHEEGDGVIIKTVHLVLARGTPDFFTEKE